MLLKQIDKMLKPYRVGLTAAEIKRALVPLKVRASMKEIREALNYVPKSGDNRYSPDGLFVMPEKASDVPVTYIANRTVTVRSVEDKEAIRKMGARYHMESHYQVQCKPFMQAFKDTCLRGHQFLLGGFYRIKNRNGKFSIKSRECLSYVQCFMVEFDDDLGYGSLDEMASEHAFIRDNAVLLMESTSGFPKSRAFFMLPSALTSLEEIDIVVQILTNALPGCDSSGTRPSNGCFGRVGLEYRVLDNWLQWDALRGWAEEWTGEKKVVPRGREIERSSLSELPADYVEFMNTTKPTADGWHRYVPCPHKKHEHDGWGESSNRCQIRLADAGKPKNGYLTACWKCRSETAGPRIRHIGRDKLHEKRREALAKSLSDAHDAEEAFVQKILDGGLDVPEAVVIPTHAEQERMKMNRVKVGKGSPLELSRPSVRLVKPNRIQEVISMLQSSREIQQAFLYDKRIVGLNAPTGAGKDETHISIVLEHDFHSIETKPHHLLAREKTDRWMAHTSAVRWMGITSGAEIVEQMDLTELLADPFPENAEWKCIQPSKVWSYMQQGGNRHLGICQTCPVNEACSRIGFNAQAAHAKVHRAIVLAIPQLFINPVYEALSEKLYSVAPRDEDIDAQDSPAQAEGSSHIRLAVMDEVKPSNLFLECELTMPTLQTWRVMWDTKELGKFAQRIESILLDERKIASLADYINSIDDELTETLSGQMNQVRERYTREDAKTVDPNNPDRVLAHMNLVFMNGAKVALAADTSAYKRLRELEIPVIGRSLLDTEEHLEMSLDEACAIGVYGNLDDMEADAIRAEVPKVYDKDWNPLTQLQILFKLYSLKGAPILYHQKELHWEVPPQLHSHIKKVMMMSATLNEALFRQAMKEYDDDILFDSVRPTALTAGSRIYQIRTGKYCRGTVLNWDTNWMPQSMKPAGDKLWGMLETEVERDRDVTHAIVTYQCVLNWKADWLAEQPNIIETANYWGLEGINAMQEADYLWILFDPEPPGETIRRYSQRFWGYKDDAPLTFTRVDGEYVDERVDRVWKSEVLAELIQAVGRARLNRVRGNVVILTGMDIPTITNREETLLFDLKDWEIDENIQMLEARIHQRQLAEACHTAHESVILDDIDGGMSEREIMKTYGVARSWIRQVKKVNNSRTI